MTRNLAHDETHRQNYKVSARNILDLSVDYSVITLLLDELNIHIQGVRSRVGQNFLESWNINELRDRLKSQLDSLGSINTQKNELRQWDYQKTVDVTLVFLGLLTLTQTLLGIVDATYNGGVNQVPGDGAIDLNIARTIRDVSFDFWLLLSFALTFIVFLLIRLRGKRGRK